VGAVDGIEGAAEEREAHGSSFKVQGSRFKGNRGPREDAALHHRLGAQGQRRRQFQKMDG
jgi:hypothetical protein